MIKELRGLGLTVVTQPGFRERGDRYLEQLSDGELRHLYRCQSLIDQGVNVSSDAPYGPISPWDVIKHSTERLTKSDVVVVRWRGFLHPRPCPYPHLKATRLAGASGTSRFCCRSPAVG